MKSTIRLLLLALVSVEAIQVDLIVAEWYTSDLEKVIARRTTSAEPEDCIRAVEEELDYLETNKPDESQDESIDDMRSFIGLKELTKVENCNEFGHLTILKCTEHLAYREWLVKTKLPDLERYQSTIVHYGRVYANICEVSFLEAFKAKRQSFDMDTWNHIEVLTSGLFEKYLIKKADTVNKSKKNKNTDDMQVDRFTFINKALRFSLINTEFGANLIRLAMMKLGRNDPNIKCLESGFIAMFGKTLNQLTNRDKCNIESLLEKYVYSPCKQFTREFRNPLHYVQQDYNLLNRLFIHETDNEDILDMQLAAAKYRICYLLTEVPHYGFVKHLNYMLDRDP